MKKKNAKREGDRYDGLLHVSHGEIPFHHCATVLCARGTMFELYKRT